MDDDSRWQLLYVEKLRIQMIEAFALLRGNGIEPITIKGWAAARNYPPDVFRFYSDIDLAVSADHFKPAKELLKSEYGIKLGIDLHRELRHLDSKPWKSVFDASREIDVDGTPVRIPSDEDHLRIMAVHWLNDGGKQKERLMDIYYAVSNRSATFDWDLCLNSVSAVRREWIVAAIGLTHRYMNLEIDSLPFADQAKNLPRWLTFAVEKEWRSGTSIKPLHIFVRNPTELFRQLRKRLPPNAVQATIEMGGHFDDGPRLRYQIGSMLLRLGPSIKGIRIKLTKGK